MVTIEKCEKMMEPKIYMSRVDVLSLLDCSMAYLYCVETEFKSGGEVKNCSISGANFQDAALTGTAISNTSFADYLVLTGATFKNVSLSGVTLADGIEVDSQNVSYIDSDRFITRK
jgi:uncharacterized protein YjbI with pentapeptide repeats